MVPSATCPRPDNEIFSLDPTPSQLMEVAPIPILPVNRPLSKLPLNVTSAGPWVETIVSTPSFRVASAVTWFWLQTEGSSAARRVGAIRRSFHCVDDRHCWRFGVGHRLHHRFGHSDALRRSTDGGHQLLGVVWSRQRRASQWPGDGRCREREHPADCPLRFVWKNPTDRLAHFSAGRSPPSWTNQRHPAHGAEPGRRDSRPDRCGSDSAAD